MGAKLLQGHVIDILKSLPDNSVQCVITSPPYWGLRDYKVEPVIWNENKECTHIWKETQPRRERHETDVVDSGSIQATNVGSNCDLMPQQICSLCSAWRGSLGLEPTPELFVKHIVDIFREVKRVLRDDGTVWLNLGDSYNGSGGSGGDYNCGGLKEGQPKYPGRNVGNLKPKDLVGIPWMVAFALRADGWYLRQDIIWHKPNPMPESVTDRCTKAHEYLFLLTKKPKYYYDADAIAEPISGSYASDKRPHGILRHRFYENSKYVKAEMIAAGVGEFPTDERATYRNKHSVWTIPTQPYPEAHFATFPEKLVEPCVRAGCPKGGTVLDPFMGSGTTGLVALREARNFIGIELKPEYIELAKKRMDVWVGQRRLNLAEGQG